MSEQTHEQGEREQYFSVRLTRREILKMPARTRRRVLEEIVNEMTDGFARERISAYAKLHPSAYYP